MSFECTLPLIKEEKKEGEDVPHTTDLSVCELQSRLSHLYQLLVKPQIIHLRGFESLKVKHVSHNIRQRVNILFFDAHIPCNWIVKIKWTHPTHTKTDVHITLLNYFVKERVKELLLEYFKNEYNPVIYLD